MSAIPNLPESVMKIGTEHPVQEMHSVKNGVHHVEDIKIADETKSTNGEHTHTLHLKDVGVRTNGTKAAPEWQLHDTPVENQRPIKVIVIGAGYSGVYCGIRIPEKLRNCELVIYEKNDGIGGTW